MRGHRWAFRAWAAGLAAAVLVTGCVNLSFVKRRLPPPYRAQGGGILFQFEAPSAQRVQLAGNWPENDWLRGQAQTGSYLIGLMEDPDKDGIWTRVENLAPGRYQYKFVIDEKTWKEDPNNPQRVDDGYGGNNSLLVVE
jgi:1,4-alpha-glucan branching enzyme